MSELRKARLAEMTATDNPTEVKDSSVLVPFNPTSLRVQISNKTAGGAQAGAQARQRPGTGEMQVSFDLIFDVADDGGDVLEQTKMVERFVRPQGTAPGKEAPPRVLFEWGTFMVQGTMDSANIDLDLFDAEGTPLRAKVSVSIKGQDPRWVYKSPPAPKGPGAGAGSGQSGQPLAPAGTPGTSGSSSALDKLVQAMPGESLQQLAARHGLDPSAWRALASGLSNPLKLALGQEVGLPVGLSLGRADGVQSQGQDPARSTASLPLVAAGQVGGGVAAGGGGVSSVAALTASQGGARASGAEALRQGQAVAVRGGLGASITQLKGEVHQAQARQTQQAFGLGPQTTTDMQDRPWGAGVPLRPRVGSAVASSAPDPQRMALGHPVSTSTPVRAGSTSTPRTTARGSRSSSTPVSRGCGCKGRRSRPARG